MCWCPGIELGKEGNDDEKRGRQSQQDEAHQYVHDSLQHQKVLIVGGSGEAENRYIFQTFQQNPSIRARNEITVEARRDSSLPTNRQQKLDLARIPFSTCDQDFVDDVVGEYRLHVLDAAEDRMVVELGRAAGPPR